MADLKNKFNRVGSDASQLQQFADGVCEALGNEDGEFSSIIDIVNQAIQNGQIKVGTKLYRHYFASSDNRKGLEVINTYPYNYEAFGECDFGGALKVRYTEDDGDNYCQITCIDQDGIMYYSDLPNNDVLSLNPSVLEVELVVFTVEDYEAL